jgi:hypothetical protein
VSQLKLWKLFSQPLNMDATRDTDVKSKSLEARSNASQDPVIVASGTFVSDDPAIRDFYGDAISEAYRMKSELVAQHLSDIGMGK